MSFRILSIDGGGVRGVVPAFFLSEYERLVGHQCAEEFDLLVGTSTGAIIACGLALGISARDLVEFYVRDAPKVFSWPFYLRPQLAKAMYKMVRPSYSLTTLREALDVAFGKRYLSNVRTELRITVVDVGAGESHVFRSSDRNHKGFSAAAAVSCSCAAPTYFDCGVVGGMHYVDGGLWANNPSMVAISEAVRIMGSFRPKELRLVSLGCGGMEFYLHAAKMAKAGLIRWGVEVLPLMFEAQASATSSYLEWMLPTENYFRINPRLPEQLVSLDNRNVIPELVSCARRLSNRYVEELLQKVPPRESDSEDDDYIPVT